MYNCVAVAAKLNFIVKTLTNGHRIVQLIVKLTII